MSAEFLYTLVVPSTWVIKVSPNLSRDPQEIQDEMREEMLHLVAEQTADHHEWEFLEVLPLEGNEDTYKAAFRNLIEEVPEVGLIDPYNYLVSFGGGKFKWLRVMRCRRKSLDI